MVRLDMSEFMERHTVSKLIGSPPGGQSPPQPAILRLKGLLKAQTQLILASAMSHLPVAKGQRLHLQAFSGV